MAYKAELIISFGAPSFLSLLTFSSAGLTLSCVGVGSLASGSPIARFSDYDTDHVDTGYDCDVTLAGIFRGNFTAVTACRNACIHDCLSFWPNTFLKLPE